MTAEERRELLRALASNLDAGVETCFNLIDSVLSDETVAERIDKAATLLEVVEELRGVSSRLKLLAYRMRKEEERGTTGENEGS